MKTQLLVHFFIFFPCFLFLLVLGCSKQDDFLNTKPNQSLATPTSLSDLKNLLQNEFVFNRSVDPALGEIASDDFYVQDAAFDALTLSLERNSYIWAKTVYDASYPQIGDWNNPYTMVYYANTVLDALPGIKTTDQTQSNLVKGTALFYRSYAFYNLLQTFTLPYDESTANTEPGIPMRLSSNLNTRPTRASQADCYNQIFSDLNAALPLLPLTPAVKTQPSQPAVNALLARIYLAMGKYSLALNYANACLAQYSSLNDYNNLNSPTATGINNGFLDEDIYHSTMVNYSVLTSRRNSVIDSAIYRAYDANDLRKTKFCAVLDDLPQYPRFVGSYDFKNYKYSGLATDEIYLIKAECLARSGDLSGAMTTLNALLKTRWVTGTFVPYAAPNSDEALSQILLERRKELLYRGLRWSDLRRLNKDSKFAIQLTKVVDGNTYVLQPNDPRYAFPIPDNEIEFGGLTQNPR